MRVPAANAGLGSISPANAPAMTFNEPRLAMFGDDLAPRLFAFTFGLALADFIGLGSLGPDGGRHHTIWRGRIGRGISDDLSASADQPFISRNQRHVRIDEQPALASRHLHIEMQMIAGAAFARAVVANRTQHLAFGQRAPADHAGEILHVRVHMQVAEADMLVWCVGDKIKRLITRHAPDDAVAHRDHLILVGLAAVGAIVAQLAYARPDIFALVTEPGRTLGHGIIAMLAEIVAPRIGVVLGLIVKERYLVDAAAVRRVLAMS